MSDELDLEVIKERVEAAMPGPWYPCCQDNEGYTCGMVWGHSEECPICDVPTGGGEHNIEPARSVDVVRATQAFIAHAREDVPALMAEVRRLRGKLTSATAELCGSCPDCGSLDGTCATKEQTFQYGTDNPVELRATVRVWECDNCKFMVTGEDAELTRTDAIVRHLQVEVKRIREEREKLADVSMERDLLVDGVFAFESKISDLERERDQLQEKLNDTQVHLEVEQREHEETKGYRQHIEQERDQLQESLYLLQRKSGGWIGSIDRDSLKNTIAAKLWGAFDAVNKSEEIVAYFDYVGQRVSTQTLMTAIVDTGWDIGSGEEPWDFVKRLQAERDAFETGYLVNEASVG